VHAAFQLFQEQNLFVSLRGSGATTGPENSVYLLHTVGAAMCNTCALALLAISVLANQGAFNTFSP
jgi:hypothetical protein